MSEQERGREKVCWEPGMEMAVEPRDRPGKPCRLPVPLPQPRGRRREPLPRSTYHTAWRPANVLLTWPLVFLPPLQLSVSSHFAGSLQVPLPFPSPRSTGLPQGVGSAHALFSGLAVLALLWISFRPMTLHSSYVNSSQTRVFSPDRTSELETPVAGCLCSLSTWLP